MKIIKSCLFLVSLLFSTVLLHAQTADEIIAKHIEAVGGKDKLAGLTSLKLETSIDAMGNAASGAIVMVNGKGYRNESDFGGQKVVQVYTDKGGWAVNPFTGINDPAPMPDDQYKGGQHQIYIEPFLDYAAKGLKVELTGKEKVGSVEAYKINLTTASGATTAYYFDPTTYYIIKTVVSADVMGQKVDIVSTYSDFVKSDYGYVMPQTVAIEFGSQFSMTSKITKSEINGTVDPAVFEMKK
ncbi:MAG: hypothetical protein ABIR18_00675 [Chitinophagaceae bacterium]